MVPSEARRMAWPICPGIESRSIIAEVAAADGAALPATAGDTDTDTDGVCGIGDAIIVSLLLCQKKIDVVYIEYQDSR